MLKKSNKYFYPLLKDGFSDNDVKKGIKVLKSKFITMGQHTQEFEKQFAKKLNVKYCVMVNSGSSANLISTFAAKNPMRKITFKEKDEAIVPVLCWPTSLWPLIQAGLKIKFVDIDPKTLNVNVDKLIKSISKRTKVVMLINVLGISSDLNKLSKIFKKKKIIFIEDNCESLGAKFKNKYLGTFGDFGTFSFFYSHQITSGEGGMVVCKNKKDYEILYSMRSHGWSRGKFQNKYKKKYPNLDSRYIFYNSGFNLRPTDIQGAIANSQFKRLSSFIKNRIYNKNLIIKLLRKDKRWNNQFNFVKIDKQISPSYMVFPILINQKYKLKKKKFISLIEKNGIETRPIISGSFVNQPASKLFKLNLKNNIFPGAQKIQDLGFVIGLHTKKIEKKIALKIVDQLFLIDKIN